MGAGMSTLAELLGRSPVSVQRISGSFGYQELNKNLTIAAVNPAKTIVRLNAAPYLLNAYAGQNDYMAASLLTSATNVQVGTLGGGYSDYIQFSLEVIDLGNIVKNVQRGTLTGSATTTTISSINPSKSLLLVETATVITSLLRVRYTLNSTSIAWDAEPGSNVTFSWQLVEFY